MWVPTYKYTYTPQRSENDNMKTGIRHYIVQDSNFIKETEALMLETEYIIDHTETPRNLYLRPVSYTHLTLPTTPYV